MQEDPKTFQETSQTFHGTKRGHFHGASPDGDTARRAPRASSGSFEALGAPSSFRCGNSSFSGSPRFPRLGSRDPARGPSPAGTSVPGGRPHRFGRCGEKSGGG